MWLPDMRMVPLIMWLTPIRITKIFLLFSGFYENQKLPCQDIPISSPEKFEVTLYSIQCSWKIWTNCTMPTKKLWRHRHFVGFISEGSLLCTEGKKKKMGQVLDSCCTKGIIRKTKTKSSNLEPTSVPNMYPCLCGQQRWEWEVFPFRILLHSRLDPFIRKTK